MQPENETPVYQLRTPHAPPHAAPERERGGVVIELKRFAMTREDRPLKCVSSRELSGGCSCHASVPANVAETAWDRAQGLGEGLDGFFHFAWQGEAWLAFGVAGGPVRGVFCPTHRVEREALASRSA